MPASPFVQELFLVRRDAMNAAAARISREMGALDKAALRQFVEDYHQTWSEIAQQAAKTQ